jgi:hypothetical protein
VVDRLRIAALSALWIRSVLKFVASLNIDLKVVPLHTSQTELFMFNEDRVQLGHFRLAYVCQGTTCFTSMLYKNAASFSQRLCAGKWCMWLLRRTPVKCSRVYCQRYSTVPAQLDPSSSASPSGCGQPSWSLVLLGLLPTSESETEERMKSATRCCTWSIKKEEKLK